MGRLQEWLKQAQHEIPKKYLAEETDLQLYYDLDSNVIHDIPDSIVKMQSLKMLGLSGHGFKEIPPVIGELPSLRHLFFDYNAISEIPEFIYRLKLRGLGVGNNICDIPPQLTKLTHLRYLKLNNKISEIPNVVRTLKNLVHLDLSDNRITRISPLIGKLPQLTHIFIDKNTNHSLIVKLSYHLQCNRMSLQNSLYCLQPVIELL